MSEIDATDLAQAASVLVRAPVRGKAGARLVTQDDHFVIVADAKSDSIAAALSEAAEALGAQPAIMRLDLMTSTSTNQAGTRPHKVLPGPLRRSLLIAPCSAYVASAPIQERPMREQLFGLIDACGIRHAHLPDITPSAFARGLQLDHAVVAEAGGALAGRLAGARILECESDAGTKLRVTLPLQARWVERFGELVPGKSTTFPAGAMFAAPEDVSGIFVANACLGEFFGAREGLMKANPVRLTIEGGRVVGVDAHHSRELQENIEAMLAFGSNSNRVGLVCLGVNAGVREPTGEASVDQNFVGLHLFIGDPAGRATGAQWTARTSFAACQSSCRVFVEGHGLLDAGRILT